jgi:hypothetical protein
MSVVSYDAMLLEYKLRLAATTPMPPKRLCLLLFHFHRLRPIFLSLVLLLVACKRCKTASISASAQYRPFVSHEDDCSSVLKTAPDTILVW